MLIKRRAFSFSVGRGGQWWWWWTPNVGVAQWPRGHFVVVVVYWCGGVGGKAKYGPPHTLVIITWLKFVCVLSLSHSLYSQLAGNKSP